MSPVYIFGLAGLAVAALIAYRATVFGESILAFILALVIVCLGMGHC